GAQPSGDRGPWPSASASLGLDHAPAQIDDESAHRRAFTKTVAHPLDRLGPQDLGPTPQQVSDHLALRGCRRVSFQRELVVTPPPPASGARYLPARDKTPFFEIAESRVDAPQVQTHATPGLLADAVDDLQA